MRDVFDGLNVRESMSALRLQALLSNGALSALNTLKRVCFLCVRVVTGRTLFCSLRERRFGGYRNAESVMRRQASAVAFVCSTLVIRRNFIIFVCMNDLRALSFVSGTCVILI